MLSVREIIISDIDKIADYWINSDPTFLVNMGVDLEKVPSRSQIRNMLTEQINTPIESKSSYALIWLLNDKPIGHCNVTNIIFGESAFMHLHIWDRSKRRRGLGSDLVKLSLKQFFQKLEVKCIYSEPKSDNLSPNKTLQKAGFEFIKNHKTIPGSINFKQEVSRWKILAENL